MHCVFAGTLRRLRSETSGFTLVEMMVTAAMLSVILSAILSLTATSEKLAPRDQEWAFTLRDSQVALHGMTRELRHTYQLNSATSTSIDATVQANGSAKRVVYDCNQPHPTDPSLKQCVRYVINGATVGPKIPIIPAVKSAAFSYEPVGSNPPKFVRVTLRIPAAGDRKDGFRHDIVLDDGIYLRNLDGG